VRGSPRPAWTWGGPSCPGESRIRLDQFTAPKWKPHFGEYFDRNSGNPFQHTDRVYWSIAPSAIHGVIDNIRTTLTELVTELIASVPRGQEVPTAEQADNAFNVAVHGKKSQITITAPQISGGSASTIDQRTAGPAADPDPAWWTLGRKIGAFIVGMFIILGAIAAIVAI